MKILRTKRVEQDSIFTFEVVSEVLEGLVVVVGEVVNLSP